ncbi:MAG TPA: dTDP-4-dehydrorhamnose reductase, partial [Gammaproteobacteria bacterium]|nr:dTDP-4-dehydrorhamnose reductase [Gammaproteobacteria bacterium]
GSIEAVKEQVTFLGRSELDISHKSSIGSAINRLAPRLIINAAAYTNVNQAESQSQMAFDINGTGVQYLAELCAERQIPLIHLSTDYVFDGTQSRPYVEEDVTHPLNVYGQSKLQGEQAIMGSNVEAMIIRISWIYSAVGHNFVKTMLKLAQAGKEITVIEDQIGSPTSALDVANMLTMLIKRFARGEPFHSGLFHFTARGETSWYGFADEIFRQAMELDLIASLPDLKPISTEAYGAALARPANSRLDCSHFDTLFAYDRPRWQDSL